MAQDQFKYSQNVHGLEEDDIPDSVIDSYLHNRADAVGTTVTKIWLETNYDGSNPQHLAVLKEVLPPFAQHKAPLIEILRATPRNDGGIVHVSRRVAPEAGLVRLRWQTSTRCATNTCTRYTCTRWHTRISPPAQRGSATRRS